jgi:uncharacterized membrane protein
MDENLFPLAITFVLIACVGGLAAFALLFSNLDQLRMRVNRLERGPVAAPSEAIPVWDDLANLEPSTPVEMPPAFEPAYAAVTSDAGSEPEPPAHNPSTVARRAAIDWEIFAGGRLLNIAGGFVLVIGIALALKYAFDKNWITESLRIGAGLVLGTGLLGFAEFLRSRSPQRWFPQGITGTGLGVLYVCGYAAFESYHIWPFTLAYAFMSCVTIAAFCLALRHDSLAVALLGWAGGFATPFLMNTSNVSEVGLASYIVLLDLGLVAIALAKDRWVALEPLALAASYTTAFAWYLSQSGVTQPFVSTIALLSIWGVFFAAGVMRGLRSERPHAEILELLGIANLFLLCSYLLDVLAHYKTVFEWVALGLAAAYVVAYGALVRRRPDASALRIQWYLCAAALVGLATAQHFHGMELTAMLAILGLAVTVVERILRLATSRQPAPEVSLATVATLCVSAFTFLLGPVALEHATTWSVFFGSRDFALSALILSGFAIDRLMRGSAVWPEPAGVILRQSAVLGILTLAALHTDGYHLAATYALLGLVAIVAGTRAMLGDLEIDGLVLAGVAIAVALFQPDTWQLTHVFRFIALENVRFESLVIIALSMLAGAELLRRRSLLPDAVARMLRAAGSLVAVAAVTLDVRDWFELALANGRLEVQTPAVIERLAHLASAEQLAISAVWILASLILITLGVKLRIGDLRLMAIGLFDLTILKAFVVDFGSMETLYRIGAFIGLGLVLLGVSYMYQRLERGFFSVTPRHEDPVPA